MVALRRTRARTPAATPAGGTSARPLSFDEAATLVLPLPGPRRP